MTDLDRPSRLPRRAAATTAVLVAFVAGFVTSCGLRTPVRPPQDTAPIIPGQVTLERDANATVVRWRRAERSADGQRLEDLVLFVVERKGGVDAAWQEAATIDVVDQEKFRRQRHFSWRDETPIEGARYRVIAVCADGQHGPPAEAGMLPDEDDAADDPAKDSAEDAEDDAAGDDADDAAEVAPAS